MNMPNANGMEIHQLTLEYPVATQAELCALLNKQEFITFRIFYRRKSLDGEVWWQDRGDIIINTAWIGKAQEYFEQDPDQDREPPQKPRNGNPSEVKWNTLKL